MTARRPTRGDLEATAAILTGAVHMLLSQHVGATAAFRVLALVGWGVYAVLRLRASRGVRRDWGLTLRGSGRPFLAGALCFVPAAAAMAIVGQGLGHLALTPGLALLLLVYPLWALVEQFLLQAMLARNLFARLRAPVVVAACSLLFAVDHMPDWPLVGATFALALALTPLYLRFKSLLPLAVVHGWLGAMFYVWVLGRDPLGVFFGVA